MKKIKSVISVDKLTLCYLASSELIVRLNEINELIDTDGCFRLVRIPIDEALFANCFRVLIKIPQENGECGYIEKEFATLKTKSHSKDGKKKNYVWLYIDNWVFYETFIVAYGNKCNWLSSVDYIADELKLVFNNITSMDIALDSNVNIANKIKRAQFNDDYMVKLNGTFRRDKGEILNNILYISTGDQIKMRTTSVVVKPLKQNGLSLKVYNKTDELEKSSKEYIPKWINLNSTVYRTEVTLKNEHLKEFYAQKGESIPNELLLTTLANQNESQSVLSEMLHYFTDRLLMFNYNPEHKGKGKTLSIFEL